MLEVNLIHNFIAPLNRTDIPYVVTGSVAAIIYGEPRITHDIDLVIRLTPGIITDLLQAFHESDYYCPPPEAIRTELARETRGHFNIIHLASGYKADFYPLGNDQLHHWALKNRLEFTLHELKLWLAPPEYVIIRKLEYYREGKSEKHLHDIKNILDISRHSLDFSFLENTIKELNLTHYWQQTRNMEQQ